MQGDEVVHVGAGGGEGGGQQVGHGQHRRPGVEREAVALLRPARPPGRSPRSTTSTSQPRPARWQAADSPPSPAPMTTARRRHRSRHAARLHSRRSASLRPVASAAPVERVDGLRRRAPAISRSTASAAPLHRAASHSSSSSSSVRSSAPAAAEQAALGRHRLARWRRRGAAWACPRGGRRPRACRCGDGSPSTPSRSSRSWNASPNGAPEGGVGREEIGPPRQRGAELERPLDRVPAGLVARHPSGPCR